MTLPEPHPHTEPASRGEFAPQPAGSPDEFAPQPAGGAVDEAAREDLAAHTPDDLGRLDLPHEGWQRVSKRFIVVELIGSVITLAVLAAAAIFIAVISEAVWQWWVAGPIALITLIYMIFTPRRVRSIGYLLRDDDLLFRRGIMWQRFVAVPYGRMQLIDVNRGPVARAFGLSELKFVTASATTGVVLPGLPADEADRLRDHLVAVAETRRTGL
ncbi:PH domain-containing protein [Okibacterium fritillariae]|uniref:PH domain-containing protein n=1 Tax=Okibacterium fritillariae TaxID=123320 RepID=UPI004055880F